MVIEIKMVNSQLTIFIAITMYTTAFIPQVAYTIDYFYCYYYVYYRFYTSGFLYY
jgi:hypothetical protein